MVDTQRIEKSVLFQEMDADQRAYWYDMKTKKFLHNIDTFYYSVKLAEDFTVESQDKKVLAFRRAVERLERQKTKKAFTGEVMQLYVPGMGDYLNLSGLRFGKYYTFSLDLPDMFDICIAPIVPGNENDISVTCEIIVQIRAEMLWLYGVTAAFEKSYEWVKAICQMYQLTIQEVKENRADFCWHTNYLEDPNRFFTKENMDAMRCTRLGKRTKYIYNDKGSDDSDFSYYARGEQGAKTFLRIYNKSMEVIQKKHKAFFLKTWLFHGLINRYDFDIYENAFLEASWDYITIARLKFYLKNGTNELYKQECQHLIKQHEQSGSYTDAMIALADKLTPPVNIIINVEFQLMRKASKSYKILPIKDNTGAGEAKRVYDFFDNRRLIVDYLTNKIFRMVEKTGDENKSRRPNCGFWTALRRTKLVDVAAVPKGLKMKRIYIRQLSAEQIKKAVIHKAVTYGMYMKGLNDDSPVSDIMLSVLCLNDNDIEEAKKYKAKRAKQLNKELLEDVMPESNYDHNYMLLDKMTGEYVDPDDWMEGGLNRTAGKVS